MKRFCLGKSELTVPAVAVGAMRLGGLEPAQAERFVRTAVELGANFFDHADIYGGGACEEVFGRILRNNPGLRGRILLQSKCSIVPGVMYDCSRKHILEAVDDSLKRLHTDHLDVLLLHRPDALVEPEEVAEAFDTLQTAGKVRGFGVSNHKPSQIRLLSRYLHQPVLADQLQLSLTESNMIRSGMEVNMTTEGAADRDGDVLDFCRLHDITIQAWSPFQHGFFKGTFLGNPAFPELNRALDELAQKYGTTNTGVAAAWLLRHPANIQVVMGTAREQRLKEICAAADIVLEREEWYRLYLAAGHILP